MTGGQALQDARGGPGTSGDDHLEIQSLTVMYGNTVAVHEVDLTVARGEFITLLGPSGSGKTSVLRSVAGFVTPASGRIVLDGEDVTKLPARLRNFGMVFQHYALFPHMSVFDNVAFGLRARRTPRGDMRDRVEQALERVRLQALAERLPHELSGGQQQRVALARALVVEPRVLLMDEPFGALDVQLREQMQSEIRTLQQELGITTMFVTHDQAEAFSMSDRIVVVNDGLLVADGVPAELYRRPQTAFTAEFVGTCTILDVPLDGDAAASAFSLAGASQPLLLSRPPDPQAARIVACLRPEQIHVVPGGSTGSPGRVVLRRFLGMNALLTVDVDGTLLHAIDSTGEVELGDETFVEWLPGDAHVVQEDAAGLPVGGGRRLNLVVSVAEPRPTDQEV